GPRPAVNLTASRWPPIDQGQAGGAAGARRARFIPGCEDADASASWIAQAPHGVDQSAMSRAHRTLVSARGHAELGGAFLQPVEEAAGERAENRHIETAAAQFGAIGERRAVHPPDNAADVRN